MGIGGTRTKFIEIVIYANGASGAAKTIDWSNGAIQKVSMTDECTFTFDNPIIGVCRLFINNSDPLGPYRSYWPGSVVWKDSAPPAFAIDQTVLAEFYYDGSNYYGQWNEYF